MKISCCGPKGAQFDGEALLLANKTLYINPEISQHNEKERTALLSALQIWCDAFGGKEEDAKIEA